MKAIMCIDASNYHYYLKSKKWRIDWEKFKAYFKRSYILAEIYYYEGIPSKGFYFDTHPNLSIGDFNDAKKIKKKYLQSLKKLDSRFAANLLEESMTTLKANSNINAILMWN